MLLFCLLYPMKCYWSCHCHTLCTEVPSFLKGPMVLFWLLKVQYRRKGVIWELCNNDMLTPLQEAYSHHQKFKKIFTIVSIVSVSVQTWGEVGNFHRELSEEEGECRRQPNFSEKSCHFFRLFNYEAYWGLITCTSKSILFSTQAQLLC